MIRSIFTPVIFLFSLLAIPNAHAQTPADTAAIQQVALDYIEGWYERDRERMRRAVHPNLVKRIVWRTGEEDRLGEQGAQELIRSTSEDADEGPRAPVGERQKDIHILDIYDNIAVVRVDSNEYIDYLQVARWNEEWKIINILWDLKPGVLEGQYGE